VEKVIKLSNGVTIIVDKKEKKKTASITVNMSTTTSNLKNYDDLIDLAKPYKTRGYNAIASPSGMTISGLRAEFADALIEKLKAYLENPKNLVPI
jgi:hypothetical protein